MRKAGATLAWIAVIYALITSTEFRDEFNKHFDNVQIIEDEQQHL